VEPLFLQGKAKEERNAWCHYTHLGQCSFGGVYQPDLPTYPGPYGNFFLIGAYKDIFHNLGLGPTATLADVASAGAELCDLDEPALAKRFHFHTVRVSQGPSGFLH